MPSLSRRRFAVTASSQNFERDSEPNQTNISVADALSGPAGELVAPTSGHGPVEDVDLDTAIAEVLMTLATDRSPASDDRPRDVREAPVAPEMRAVHQDDASSDVEDEGETLDAEGSLASEAATFRLLGELDRLWRNAA